MTRGSTDSAGRRMDELAITGIHVFAHHGVLDFERRDGQGFVIDLRLGLDTRPAASSDDLRDTADYGTLVRKVVAAASAEPVNLIETLADRVARLSLTETSADWVEVSVHKPDAPIEATFDDVVLTIRRSRSD